MASPFGTLVVVADLEAGRGSVRRQLPEVESILRRQDLPYVLAPADGAVGPEQVVRSALDGGDRFVVTVGGDRLVHEVVNALLGDGKPPGNPPILGLVAAGAENDFLRTFGLPEDATAAAHLAGEGVFPIDVVRAVFLDHAGRETERYFANVAEAGLGGEVGRRAGRGSREPAPAARFRAFWSSVVSFRRANVRVTAARKQFEGPAYNVVVGNGRFGGGGWRISPRSFPGDGVLDVVILKGPRSAAFTTLPQVYRGEQVPGRSYAELRGRDVAIEADRPLPLSLDGQYVGTTPARMSVLPKALLLKI